MKQTNMTAKDKIVFIIVLLVMVVLLAYYYQYRLKPVSEKHGLFSIKTVLYAVFDAFPINLNNLAEKVNNHIKIAEKEIKRLSDVDNSIKEYGKVKYIGKEARVIRVDTDIFIVDKGWIFKDNQIEYKEYLTIRLDNSETIIKVTKDDSKVEPFNNPRDYRRRLRIKEE